MLFNSFQFVALFLIVLALHRALDSQRARVWLLLCASCVFYAAWSAWFLLLLLLSVIMDYFVGLALAAWPRHGRPILAASIVVNLGVLVLFKYADFMLGNLAALAQWVGYDWHPKPLGWPLPLGISFYTFMTLSYTIDVYRRVCSPERSLTRYATFLLFFPHLASGPILRAREFLPQLHEPDPSCYRPYFGINRIAIGFIKKILLADLLNYLVAPVIDAPAGYDGPAILFATYLFAFRAYFDFSGYCDIAVGAAALLGYRLPENFDSPFLATNVVELWRRWHITLSRWLRDYLYIPLGGNRKGTARTCVNLMVTMLLGGLWHGATWNFVIWGGLQGVLLIAHRLYWGQTHSASPPPLRLTLRAVLMFQFFAFSLLVFRAPGLEAARIMIARVFELPTANPLRALAALAFSPLALFAYSLATRARRRWETMEPRRTTEAVGYGVALAAGVIALSLFGARQSEFFYFHF